MQKLKQSFLTIVIGLALAAGLSYAWTGPTANPPNNNAPAPINVSGNEQEFVDNKKLKVKGGGGVLDLWGALKVNGIFQLVDGTQGTGKVLTSDKDGIASWKTTATSTGGGVSGSGTMNYVSKWTNSATLGNSQIFDNGTNIGIGTNDPKAKLDILGNIKIIDGKQGKGKVLTSDENGKASWEGGLSGGWYGECIQPFYQDSGTSCGIGACQINETIAPATCATSGTAGGYPLPAVCGCKEGYWKKTLSVGGISGGFGDTFSCSTGVFVCIKK